MTVITALSPAELILAYCNSVADQSAVPHIVVGPATDEEQEQGVASIMGTGSVRIEDEIPLIWPRLQVRCIARTLSGSDSIAWALYNLLDDVHKVLVTQPSTGLTYLIKQIQVDVSPSHHYDSPETWETLAFIKCGIATTPVT